MEPSAPHSPPTNVWWKFALTGIGAGFISTLFGIGGGVLMVPVLSIWLGLPVKEAVGTSLVSVIGFALVGITVESIQYPDHIVWNYVLLMSVGSLIGVFVGKKLSSVAPDWILKFLFTMMLMISVAKFLNWIELSSSGNVAVYESLLATFGWEDGEAPALMLTFSLATLLGFTAGLASAMLGIGGGVVFVPGLVILFATYQSDLHPPRATSLATIVITSMYGGYLYTKSGNVLPRAIRVILPMGMIGAVGGVFVAGAMAHDSLLKLFAIFLGFLAVQMFVSAVKDLAKRRSKKHF